MPLRLPAWISPKITIDATPAEFEFSGPGGVVRYSTLIRLNDARKILQIGDDALRDEPASSLIRLFEPRFDRDAFVRFCRYSLLLAQGSSSFAKPAVLFRGAADLRDLLGGDAAAMLEGCLLEAGAARSEIRFG